MYFGLENVFTITLDFFDWKYILEMKYVNYSVFLLFAIVI